MEVVELAAEVREVVGKSGARKCRNTKKVPGIIYGPKMHSIPIVIDEKRLLSLITKGPYKNRQISLSIQKPGKLQKMECFIKEIQFHPISGEPLHIDLYRVPSGKEIRFQVPIRILGTPLGSNKGGELRIFLDKLWISGLYKDLVDAIEVDVSNLEIGNSILVKDLKVPEGLKVEHSPLEVVASVVGATENSGS